jgi:hypothetical protein
MNPKVATLNSPVIHNSMPSADEVNKARSFLRGQVFTRAGEIPPRRFAAASKETGSSFSDLLSVIARSYAGGQGSDLQRQEDISAAAKSGA